MGLQITIFVSVLFFTSLVPHRKKNSGICSMVLTTPRGVPPCPLCEPIHCCHPSHRVSLYRMPDRRRPCLVKQNPVRLPQHICQTPEAQDRGHPIGHVVIAWVLPRCLHQIYREVCGYHMAPID